MSLKKMEAWQKRRLFITLVLFLGVTISFLVSTCTALRQDRLSEKDYWDAALTPSESAVEKMALIDENATRVRVGTYVETFKELSLKNSSYRMEFLLWFRWNGDEDLDMANNFRIYKGTVNKMQLLKDYHKDGENYQLLRVDASVFKNYWTIRFPLESHQLRMYIESNYTADRVVFENDKENCGVNGNLDIPGYGLVRHETGIFTVEASSNNGDPEYSEGVINSEFVTALEVNRNSWGLYLKCFIALFGTTTWVLITLFINTYHHVDPLSMIPAALFGTVSNIMVGANLLPDVLQLGLLEFVNTWGVITILSVAMVIININRIRNKYQDKEFASFYGKIMFYTIVVTILAGHIALPLSALMR